MVHLGRNVVLRSLHYITIGAARFKGENIK